MQFKTKERKKQIKKRRTKERKNERKKEKDKERQKIVWRSVKRFYSAHAYVILGRGLITFSH